MPPTHPPSWFVPVLPLLAATLALAVAVPAQQANRPLDAHVERPVDVAQLDARPLLECCDRLVLARVERVHTFDAPSKRAPEAESLSKAERTTAPIRYAELAVLDAPFGSKDERIVVRLAHDAKEPSGVQLWPLGPNLRYGDEDWKRLDELERTLAPARAFGIAFGARGAWPVHASEGGDVVDVPTRFLAGATTPKSADRDVAAPDSTCPLPLAALTRDVRAELARSTPRVEAKIVSNGPSWWRAVVERDELVLAHDLAAPAWSAVQREQWRALWSALDFDALPARVGRSRGPDEAIFVLARVTERGRETVRAQWTGPAASDPTERAMVERVRAFWDGFRALVPQR
ncbi:MAG: hypothetical protein IPJ77_01915 [Planctomycetes bacterium]|nr:hypothetical protein [Planctomycetota bacterium]